MNSMDMIRIFVLILVEFHTNCVHCGCYEKQLCCVGRNLSCVSIESDNNIVPDVEVNFQNRVRNPRMNERFRKSIQKKKAKKFRRSDNGFSSVYFEPTDDDKLKSEELHDSHFGLFIEDIERDQKDDSFLRQTTKEPSPKPYRNSDLGFSPVVFEPEFDDNNMKSEELEVSHFGLEDEPEIEAQKYVTDNIEYKGKDKEIRYVIINHIPSKEKVGHLKSHQRSPSNDKSGATCFCDEMCQKFSDCCSDYRNFCPSVDCQVTEWSDWSFCESNSQQLIGYHPNNNCGPGISKRFRTIVVKSQNGGAHCPHVYEEKSCFNMDGTCRDEVALLLPYNFGAPRVPGYRNKTYFDLPKDIFKFKQLKNSCVLFRSIWFNNCAEQTSRSVFLPNSEFCVECQPTAYLSRRNESCVGEGSTTALTHWSLINAKTCFGQWIQIEKQNDCKCDESYPSFLRFIFV